MVSTEIRKQINSQKWKAAIVLVLLAALCVWQRHFVIGGFTSNVYLNGGIVAVFLFGLGLAYSSVRSLRQEEIAFKALQEAFDDIRSAEKETVTDPFGRYRRCLEAGTVFGKPKLLGHVYELTIEELRRTRHVRISLGTMESMVSAIMSKMAHERALLQYIVGLMVFLGLIGTFIGLMEMVRSVGGIIGGLAGADASSTDAFRKLLSDLEAPLVGMATGFSASLFGLFGSLVLGLISRFVNSATYVIKEEFEAWLATVAQIESAAGGGTLDTGQLDTRAASALAATLSTSAQSLDRNAAAIEALVSNQEDNRMLALATFGVLERLLVEQSDVERAITALATPVTDLASGFRQEFINLRSGIEDGFGRAAERIERRLSSSQEAHARRFDDISEQQSNISRFSHAVQAALEGELQLLSQTVERVRAYQDDQAERLNTARHEIISTLRGLDARAELKTELRTIAAGVEVALAASVGDLARSMNGSLSTLATSLELLAERQAHAASHLATMQAGRVAPDEVRAMTQALEAGMASGFTEVYRAIASAMQVHDILGRQGQAEAWTPPTVVPARRAMGRQGPVATPEDQERAAERKAAVEDFYETARRRMANGNG